MMPEENHAKHVLQVPAKQGGHDAYAHIGNRPMLIRSPNVT